MVKIQGTDIADNNSRVWFIIGQSSGLFQATVRYLQSRGQIVLCNTDLKTLSKELNEITERFANIDMLVVNDFEAEDQLESLVDKVYSISSCMHQNGTSRIIFLVPGRVSTHGVQNTDFYRNLKRDMKDRSIDVHCFEPSYDSEKTINLGM